MVASFLFIREILPIAIIDDAHAHPFLADAPIIYLSVNSRKHTIYTGPISIVMHEVKHIKTVAGNKQAYE